MNKRDTDNNLQKAVDFGFRSDKTIIEKYHWEKHELFPSSIELAKTERAPIDWNKVNFGVLHKILKKMLSSVDENQKTGIREIIFKFTSL